MDVPASFQAPILSLLQRAKHIIWWGILWNVTSLLAQENGQLRSSDHAKSGCGQRNAIEFKRGILFSTIKIFRINF